MFEVIVNLIDSNDFVVLGSFEGKYDAICFAEDYIERHPVLQSDLIVSDPYGDVVW